MGLWAGTKGRRGGCAVYDSRSFGWYRHAVCEPAVLRHCDSPVNPFCRALNPTRVRWTSVLEERCRHDDRFLTHGGPPPSAACLAWNSALFRWLSRAVRASRVLLRGELLRTGIR